MGTEQNMASIRHQKPWIASSLCSSLEMGKSYLLFLIRKMRRMNVRIPALLKSENCCGGKMS